MFKDDVSGKKFPANLLSTTFFQGDEPVLIIPLPVNQDKFNIKYYNGTKRRKFTSRYGLNEALFAKHKQPLTLGLLDMLNEKVDFEKVATEAKAEEVRTHLALLFNEHSGVLVKTNTIYNMKVDEYQYPCNLTRMHEKVPNTGCRAH